MASDEVIVGAVKKLDVKPGDCIVLEVRDRPSLHNLRCMDELMKLNFPGVKTLLCEGLTLAGVLTKPQELGKEDAPEGEGEKT